MSRRASLFVRLLLSLYPRWLRDERGAALEESYRELWENGDPAGRGRLRLSAWLLRDAITTSVRARLAGPHGGDWKRASGRGDGMMRTIMKELRQTVRTLLRSPGFALVAVVTMALGIGVNTAIFSVVHSVLLRPLPYDGPDEIVRVLNRYQPSGTEGWVSAAEFWEFREQSAGLESLVPLTPDAANLTGLPEPMRVQGLMVGSAYFDLLGSQPFLGRGFTADEEEPGQEPVIILSHALWRSAFGSDPAVLGRAVQLDGRSRTVVGVMGPDYEPLSGYLFTGRPEQYFIPVVLDPAAFSARTVERHNLMAVGRLSEGVGPATVETNMMEAVRRLERTYPGISGEGNREVAVTELHEAVVGPVRGTLLLLALAAGLVLLVACVNVANLMLARADTRTAELAVRAAMGAGRRRLIGHGLSESAVIGLVGGAVGLALMFAGRDGITALVPSGTPLPDGVGVGVPVLVFTVVLAMLAGALAGLFPAIQVARGDVFGALKNGSGQERGGRSLLRRALIVGQVAGVVVLVTGAGLLVRSLVELRAVETGFDATDLYGIQVSASRAGYDSPQAVGELYRSIEDQVARLPGVEAAAASWQTPLQTGMSDYPVMPQRAGETEWYSADPNLVGPGFFETYGIEIVEGRGFESGDMATELGPVILNRTAAERLWPDGRAVGRYVNLNFGDPQWREVIGVAEDIRGRGLAEEPRVQTYMTYGNGPWGSMTSLQLGVRSQGGTRDLQSAVESIVRGLDADIPVGPVESMEAAVSSSIERERILSVLLGAFSLVALVLGAVGVYGVIAFSVGRRTREIGLRMAMGARPGSVLTLVVRQGLAMGVLGIGLGLVGALAVGRVLEGFLYGVSGSDPATLGGVAVTVLLVVAVASWLPARRVAGVDPLVALRE